jgi:chaperonin GroEL (HSP60 family)
MSKLSSIASATEGATLILSIDQTIKAPKPDQDVKMKKARGGRRM